MSASKSLIQAAAGAGGGLPDGAPTDATTVFEPYIYSGNNATNRGLTGVAFAPDMGLFLRRNSSATLSKGFYDRERGDAILCPFSNKTNVFFTGTAVRIGSFTSDGVVLPSNASLWNGSGSTYCIEFFKEAPAFFDIVLYSGDGTDGREVSHNLEYPPELIIVKRRSADADWAVFHKDLTSSNSYLQLNSSAGEQTGATVFGGDPTDTTFTVGSSATTNGGGTYLAYLFATVPDVSFVGTYTGNGSSQTIDCGFSSSARFILIKRKDASGNFYSFDSARGINASNDPFVELNSDSQENPNGDSVDTNSSGFVVNQNATTNINVSSAEYVFYAVA